MPSKSPSKMNTILCYDKILRVSADAHYLLIFLTEQPFHWIVPRTSLRVFFRYLNFERGLLLTYGVFNSHFFEHKRKMQETRSFAVPATMPIYALTSKRSMICGTGRGSAEWDPSQRPFQWWIRLNRRKLEEGSRKIIPPTICRPAQPSSLVRVWISIRIRCRV